jgi:hypothetical protein
MNYSQLKSQEESYQMDIELLRFIQGPALYEDLVMGFKAGKEYLVDPLSTAMKIDMNRLPERCLLD